MMSSASPSGASSQATQTGRPSLWTESDQRKLTRLYVYTTLPLKKILNVLNASNPEEGPGKDSANKKLNAMLDKEPRWLKPRSRSDMERRLNELGHSPTRNAAPPSILSRLHSHSVTSSNATYSSIPADIKNEVGNSPTVHEIQTADTSTAAAPGSYTSAGAPLPTITTHVDPPRVSFTAASQSAEYGKPSFAADILRRATVMTNSTEMTTTSIQDALSGYSIGFMRSVKKVMKRYTMPVNTEQNESPISDHSRPGSAQSMQGDWMYDDGAPPPSDKPRPTPGDFLRIDHLLSVQGVCLDGLQEHDCRTCLCHVKEELTSDQHWVTHHGPSPRGFAVLQAPHQLGVDLTGVDPFGNTTLHFVAARDAHPQCLLRLIGQHPNLAATNSAGETFLHVLGPSWFVDLARPEAPLHHLLHMLRAMPFDLYARDVYGRTFLHVLRTKGVEPNLFGSILQAFDPMLYCRRDAMGVVPQSQPMAPITPLRRAVTEVHPRISNHALPRPHVDPVVKQNNLLRLVQEARTNPRIEDDQGRNGLHCLAAVILSPNTLLAKYGDAGGQAGRRVASGGGGGGGSSSGSIINRKRKRETNNSLTADAPTAAAQGLDRAFDRPSDSSKERLTLRETCVYNLLASGVDVNHYDNNGNTVLMAFVAHLPEDDDYKVPVSILQLLINHGADVNARNRAGETALHVAVRYGRKLAMRTLQQAKANVHARDGAGRSILDVADAKLERDRDEKMYSHYEACRAWLSGQGMAVQNPTVHQEWGQGRS